MEFKQELGDGAEFLETIVAFSNGSGGTIFIGVNDNSRIIGYVPENKDHITNLIASNVEPTIEAKIITFQLDIRKITIVEIPMGNNKPYSHRELGVYIRKGATDRMATRTDLDQIYSKRQ